MLPIPITRTAPIGRRIAPTSAPIRYSLRIFFTVFSFWFFTVLSLRRAWAPPPGHRSDPCDRAAPDTGYACGSFSCQGLGRISPSGVGALCARPRGCAPAQAREVRARPARSGGPGAWPPLDRPMTLDASITADASSPRRHFKTGPPWRIRPGSLTGSLTGSLHMHRCPGRGSPRGREEEQMQPAATTSLVPALTTTDPRQRRS